MDDHTLAASLHPDVVAVVTSIAAERRARRLTQIDVAEISGISQATISRIESGNAAAFPTVAAYARAVGLRLTTVPLDGWGE